MGIFSKLFGKKDEDTSGVTEEMAEVPAVEAPNTEPVSTPEVATDSVAGGEEVEKAV